MMITIYGLPPKTTFQAVKALVKQECNIIDFILDNLVADGPDSKKVRIGVSDDAEGYRIIKCLNGFRMSPSHLLKIVPVGKPLNPPPQQNYDQRNFQNQPRNEYLDRSQPNYQQMDDYREPHSNTGPHPPTDTQKGNYIMPNIRPKKINRNLEPINSDPLRTPNVRPHNMAQTHHSRELHGHGPQSHNTGLPEAHSSASHGLRSGPGHPISQGSQDPMHSAQWPTDVSSSSNQWGAPSQGNMQGQNAFNQRANQSGFGQQHGQSSQNPYVQGRDPPGHANQGFVFQPKPNISERVVSQRETRQHVLRTVDIVDTVQPTRQYQQEKPITIMKDNFQGPGQYPGPTSQHGNYQDQQHTDPVWHMNPQPKPSYDNHHHSRIEKRPDTSKPEYEKRGQFVPIGRPLSPSRRPSPTRAPPPANRSYQQSNRHLATTMHDRDFQERRVSPNIMGPPSRDFSPSGRRISPARRISPGRRISPSRRISPVRRISPTDRRMSPGRRKVSPRRRDDVRRISPSDKRVGRRESPRRFSPNRFSPTRRLVSPPRSNRFSPSRLGDKPSDKFMDIGKGSKAVRPAYEPTQAPNQTYTGGYRDNVQYTPRQELRVSPWQNEKIIFPSNAKEEDRREMPRPVEKSPGRISRSPRRDRSPLKDRYRRSPSPRSSRSPRRSWALEKRSPEIREPPPPPVWPGQEPDPKLRKPNRFDLVDGKANVWNRLDEHPFEEKLRVRTDMEGKFADKFAQRREFDARDYQDRKRERSTDRDRERSTDRDRDYHRSDDRPNFRRDSPPLRRDDKKVFNEIDKEFQDIYKRAVEFRKKAEERQKSGEKRREEYNRLKEDNIYRPESPRRSRSRDHEWNKDRKRVLLPPSVKAKREKAINDISNRIIDKYELGGDQKYRVTEELRVALGNIFVNMFGDKDVSFIELVIKYQAKYTSKEEEKLMQELMLTLPTHYRNLKRKATEDDSEISAKVSRRSPQRNPREENDDRPKLSDSIIPDWNLGMDPPKVLNMSLSGMSMVPGLNFTTPGMVPPPVYLPTQIETFQSNVFNQQQPLQFSNSSVQQQHFTADLMQQQQQYESSLPKANEGYNLYLCQDDFEPFSSIQSEYLKNFLYNQIVKVTETSNGWAPDITLKGLQSAYRYELSTMDERSKDWVLNLNFSEFEYFNVLVYTKEQLWYERAAIWLPGHSRSRAVEPLEKLKLQNRNLEGINIGKWKFVKKIVTVKGTRLYVDMPPSSARALEKHKMLLSYELQKVNVFLKAVAVDKDVFDAGLKEISITDPSSLTTAVQNSPMPTLNANSEPGIVKIGLNGYKSLTVEQARKIKEVVVYHLVKYLQHKGPSRTDFKKFGFLPPNFIGIVPDNMESKKWLMSRTFGKMARTTIVVFGDDNDNIKYFKMFAMIPHEYHSSATLAFERLKQSNQGVKGIHFNLWKPCKLTSERKKARLEIDIDLESIETISEMKYKLDYVGEYGIQVVNFESEYSYTKLEEKIKKCKLEQVDSYDVANMELDSDSDKDDVICIN